MRYVFAVLPEDVMPWMLCFFSMKMLCRLPILFKWAQSLNKKLKAVEDFQRLVPATI